ncbi:MAG: glycoside hydrolase family 95 protein [Clostridia bacterium]|nr:glycoside hydrolase family 95 protein [Clostridia bacterium]
MNKTLKFKSPATYFEESILLGNGFMGAAVYGGTDVDRYSMNESTLWSGYPDYSPNPNGPKVLKKARELIADGKYLEAAEQIEQGFTGHFSQSYLPLCSIYIETGVKEFDSYSRTLDMENGICKVEYLSKDAFVSRESFISNPDRVMVVKIKQKGIPITQIYIKSELQCSITTDESSIILRGTAPCYDHPVGWRRFENKRPTYYEADSKKGMKYKGILKVECNGTLRFNGDYMELIDTTEATLYFAACTSFNGFNKHPYSEGLDVENRCNNYIFSAISKSYETLKSAHIRDFSYLFNRTDFTLCDNTTTLPTDAVLKEHKSNALYELLFNFGKYLTISASRKGGQPMHLQGIWNEQLDPPWNSNYTININTQMNYLPTMALNLAECFDPYVTLATELAVEGRKIAKEWYGVDGVISHHNTDIWRMANPVGSGCKGSQFWAFFNTSFGWILWGLSEKFRLEKDMDYLQNTLYPLLTECAETYISLFCEDENGNLFISPATSPENIFVLPNGEVSAVTKYSAINNAICRDTLKAAAEFALILNKNDAAERYTEYANRVIPYEISSDGRIMEWDTEYPEAEIQHRHVSHLYGLHPAREINPTLTPELTDAAKKSLDVRGDAGTGWCIAWKANMWARLFDGNRALKLLDNQLEYVDPSEEINYSKGGTYPNMLCAHPPFQIDGNFGATSAIIEMIVQCNGNNIHILPALPDKWQSGEIKGICITDGATIDIKWQNRIATDVKIHPEAKADNYNLIY